MALTRVIHDFNLHLQTYKPSQPPHRATSSQTYTEKNGWNKYMKQRGVVTNDDDDDDDDEFFFYNAFKEPPTLLSN
jgi:hypothetical protein